MEGLTRALEELRRRGGGAPVPPASADAPVDAPHQPDPALIQAVADLLTARCALYDQQAGHSLIPLLDRTLRYLLEPSFVALLGGV